MYSALDIHDRVYINEAGNTLYRTKEAGSKPLKLGNSFSVRVGLTVPLNRIARYEDADMTSYASKKPMRWFGAIGGGWNILLTRHRFKNDGTTTLNSMKKSITLLSLQPTSNSTSSPTSVDTTLTAYGT